MPGEWYEMNDGGHFSVAGYSPIGGDWSDVEKGDLALESSPYDLWDVDRATFHYVNEDTGADVYYTIHGPFDDYESLESIIADTLDRYGVE